MSDESNIVCVTVGTPSKHYEFNGDVIMESFTTSEEYLASKGIFLTTPCTRVSITAKNCVSSKYAELVRNFFRYQDLGWGKKFFNITTGPIGKILMIQNHRANAVKHFNDCWNFHYERKRKRDEESDEENYNKETDDWDNVTYPAPQRLYFNENDAKVNNVFFSLRGDDEPNKLSDEDILRGQKEVEDTEKLAKEAGELFDDDDDDGSPLANRDPNVEEV